MSTPSKYRSGPIYINIMNTIKDDISKGVYNPGDMLPSEQVLMDSYGASRDTVRKGLKALEGSGYIYAQAGKGYFIADPGHDRFSFEFSDVSDSHLAKHHKINVVTPTEETRAALELAPGRYVIEISRILLSQEAPIAYDQKFLPYEKGLPLIESEIKYTVFPEIAMMQAPPFAFYTKMEITVELAGQELCQILECDEGEPLLVITRHIIGQDDRKIGYGKKYMKRECGGIEAWSGYMPD